MVSKGFAGAAALALALASSGAFAPGAAFVKSPLNPAAHGFSRIVNMDGSVVVLDKVSQLQLKMKVCTVLLDTTVSLILYFVILKFVTNLCLFCRV
jgi:hypothetical protein